MNTFWTWDASLDTGIGVIDRHHRKIVEYINALYQAHVGGEGDRVNQLFQELADFTALHFSFEEDLLDEAGYPIVEAHKKVHQAFTKRVRHLYRMHAAGKDIIPQLLSDFRVWLTNHIRLDDQDYRPFVQRYIKRKRGNWFQRVFHCMFHN